MCSDLIQFQWDFLESPLVLWVPIEFAHFVGYFHVEAWTPRQHYGTRLITAK